MKIYRLRHKYLQDFGHNDCNYLNYDIETGIFYLESFEDTEDYQTIFTDEEIENFVKNNGLNLMDWIKEEV